jgi:hypothetical protein
MANTSAFLKTDPCMFINNYILSFTHASIATRVNSAGVIEEVR